MKVELKGGLRDGERVEGDPDLGSGIRKALGTTEDQRFIFFLNHNESGGITGGEVYGRTDEITPDGLPVYRFRKGL